MVLEWYYVEFGGRRSKGFKNLEKYEILGWFL
jgi:hypothetical protein